jgi:hypothetical protein
MRYWSMTMAAPVLLCGCMGELNVAEEGTGGRAPVGVEPAGAATTEPGSEGGAATTEPDSERRPDGGGSALRLRAVRARPQRSRHGARLR